MQVVIVGAGEVGAYLAEFLVSEQHHVTILDVDADKIRRLGDTLDLKTYVGSGTHADCLEQIEAGRSDLFLALTDSDEANMLAAYFAKVMGAKTTVARVCNPDAITGHPAFYRTALGIDKVVNPAMQAAAEATAVLQMGNDAGIAEFGFGRIHLRPFTVETGSKFTKKPIKEQRLPGALIAAVIRDGEVHIPGGEDQLEAGDRLFVICKPEAVQYVQKGVGESREVMRRIIIVGGGDIGAAIAHYFDHSRYRVKLFEDSQARATELADELNYVKVILGDGSDLDILEEEYLDSTHAFVASTGVDEVNLMAALLAKEHGVERTVAVVEKPQFAQLGKRLGLTATLAPRILVANQILTYIRGGRVNRVHLIAEGQAEVLEFQVTEHSKLIGKPLMSLGLPRGIIIGAIVRGNKALIPKGDDVLEPGDALVVFTLEKHIGRIESLLAYEHTDIPNTAPIAESEA